jgi:hypothetical protein
MKNNAQNSVTIFTRGIAHFRKVVALDEPTKTLNIPFRKDAMDEVLATLDAFGPVKYKVPPSYTPENVNNRLTLNPDGVFEQLAKQLSGSAVTVKVQAGVVEGTLVGTDKVLSQSTQGNVFTTGRFLVVLSSEGLQRIPWDSIKSLTFTDEKIQEEVNAALARNLQNIKPDSTFIELELERTNEDNDAVATIEYAIPLAAWKMRYSFRQTEEGCQLIGSAVVDNNTDEDWLDVIINVVTGDPITFRTDLNEVRVPNRDFIALVNEKALGNVSVEEGRHWAAPAGGMRSMAKSRGGNIMAASMTMESCDAEEGLGFEACSAPQSAEFVEVEAKDVGDFQVFSTKEPLTIRANKSAIIPMFMTKVDASSRLLYKEQNHATRPYRSLAFTNDTGFSLGKGKAVVNDEGLFAGEAVLETTKPKEDRVMPYCLENGVKVQKDPQQVEAWQNALSISKGVAVTESVSTQETFYTIKNLKDESFELLLEHACVLGEGAVYAFRKDGNSFDPTVEKITNGIRVSVNLEKDANVNFVVKERKTSDNRVVLNTLRNLVSVIQKNDKLMEDKQVQACISAQEAIDTQQEAITELDERYTKMMSRCELLRQNIESVGSNQAQADQFNTWVSELDTATNEITAIDDDKRPEAEDNLRELNITLRAELKKLSLSWEK